MRIILVVILASIALTLLWNTSEKFDVLGAKGNFAKPYFRCLSQCEREDPSKRMGKPNLYCSMFCDSIFTSLARRGNSDSGLPYGIPPKYRVSLDDEPYDNSEKCFLENIDRLNVTNLGECYCRKEIKKKCDIECAYSPRRECKKLCTKFYLPNCRSSWNFK